MTWVFHPWLIFHHTHYHLDLVTICLVYLQQVLEGWVKFWVTVAIMQLTHTMTKWVCLRYGSGDHPELMSWRRMKWNKLAKNAVISMVAKLCGLDIRWDCKILSWWLLSEKLAILCQGGIHLFNAWILWSKHHQGAPTFFSYCLNPCHHGPVWCLGRSMQCIMQKICLGNPKLQVSIDLT